MGVSPAPPIETSGLTKHYGSHVGIEDVSVTVESGEVFGFLGPNGAGKSTMIRTLLGFLKPTRGEAWLSGHSVTDRRELAAAKRDVGHIPGDFRFYENVTGTALLDYFGRLRGDERREELLSLFPPPVDNAIKTYSRGNRQKLAIVQAFMHDPALVVMDEPTSGLDPLVQQTFYEFLDRERAGGTTVFFSTHILGEVREVCDRVAIIRNGRLVAVERVERLLEKSGKVVVVRTADPVEPATFDFSGVIDASRTDDGALRLVLTGNYDALVDRLDEHTIDDLEVRETALEDVFMHFYSDA